MTEFLDLQTRVMRAIRALAEMGLQRYGLHLGQEHLLAALWARDGATPGELASMLKVTTPTVVKMASRMANAGLLVRRRDDRDNRLVRLWLTDVGRALEKPIEEARRQLEADLIADLSQAEREQFLSALRTIHKTATSLLEAGDQRAPKT